MADFDAEQAFLRSMQEGNEESSASTPLKQQETSSSIQEQQPQTIGGFIVDDEDDEDEDEPAGGYDNAINIQNSQKVENKDLNVERDSSSTPLPQSTLTKSPNNALASSAPSRTASATPSLSHQKKFSQVQSDHAQLGHADNVPRLATENVPSNSNDVAHSEQAAATTPSDPNSLIAQSGTTAPSADVSSVTSLPKARLPHDRIGILEDRIEEDPKGDAEAWLSLIAEYKKRNKKDEVRNVYSRFFQVFPQTAEQWVAYANWELENHEFNRVAQIFQESLMKVPNLQLWNTYLNYVRRRNNITTDPSGNARQVVSQTYDFVLQHVGNDKDAGQLWIDYVQFLRSGPGQVGGTSWQDQQKMDTLRKTYQRAVCIPTSTVNALWKEYDTFEMDINKNNKAIARQFLQQKSPAYMTARAANTTLQGLIRDIDRTTLPSLPPADGYEGDVEYLKQVHLWQSWIKWEKDDPLAIKEEDPKHYKDRILYVYRQALMSLRFWPRMWFEAAEFCFDNDLESVGAELLKEGFAANPESCLLAFRQAERIESTTNREEGDENLKRRGDAVREPFEKVLDTLYYMIKLVENKEAEAITRIKEDAANQLRDQNMPSSQYINANDDDEDDDAGRRKAAELESLQQAQIDALKASNSAQTKLLSRTITAVWITLMQAMRRVQGKGRVGGTVGGTRQIVTDARRRGRLTFDFYIAAALIEYHCYKDPAATKLWDRGMKLFPYNEDYALIYLKHLVSINDFTNARAVFETSVSKLATTPENIVKSKPLYAYFHTFESQFGELTQILKLEKRMKDLFPEDPKLYLFSRRNRINDFDPALTRLIVSYKAQARSKAILPSIERSPSTQSHQSRHGSLQPSLNINSPKRPLEESDTESYQPRKIARGESPLKGAAGRRLDAAKRSNLRNESNQNGVPQQQQHLGLPAMPPVPVSLPQVQPAQPLPREIMYLLSIIPPAHSYNATRFNSSAMVNLLRTVDMSKANISHMPTPTPQPAAPPTSSYGYQAPPQGNMHQQMYGYGR